MKTKTKELEKLEQVICKASNVTIAEILSPDRSREIVDARHAIWLIAHKNLGYSFKYLAKIYGRDRTTIMHGIQRMLYTDAPEILTNGLGKTHPELLLKDRNGEPKGIKDWKFETGDNLGISVGDSDVEK